MTSYRRENANRGSNEDNDHSQCFKVHENESTRGTVECNPVLTEYGKLQRGRRQDRHIDEAAQSMGHPDNAFENACHLEQDGAICKNSLGFSVRNSFRMRSTRSPRSPVISRSIPTVS